MWVHKVTHLFVAPTHYPTIQVRCCPIVEEFQLIGATICSIGLKSVSYNRSLLAPSRIYIRPGWVWPFPLQWQPPHRSSITRTLAGYSLAFACTSQYPKNTILHGTNYTSIVRQLWGTDSNGPRSWRYSYLSWDPY